MARKKRPYKNLQRFSFNIFSAPSLWIGPDHLLSVDAVLFQETYKRFYYSDIQAIVMIRSNRHHLWTAIWGVLALLCGLVVLFSSGDAYISGTFLGLFATALIVNLALGPACKAHIQTAVQIQNLRSFRRMRSAGKAMDRIKSMVEQAQGALDLSALTASIAGSNATASHLADSRHPLPTSSTQQDGMVGPFNILPHRVLYGLLLAMGIISFAQFGLKNLPLGVIGSLMHAAAQVMAIVALVRGYQPLKGTWLGRFSWISLGLTLLASTAGYILFFMVATRHPELAYNNWGIYKRGFEMFTGNTPLMLAMSLFFAAGYLLVGLLGLLVVRQFVQSPSDPTGSQS
ncbi:MAG: hypothetical protein PVI89_06395 [Desulfobacteraceae bacterium]|jgi:hypothetical protein